VIDHVCLQFIFSVVFVLFIAEGVAKKTNSLEAFLAFSLQPLGI
jgi:hypothetical protein